MRKARRDGRVAHCRIVAILMISLVGRARVRRAGDGDAVGRGEARGDVDAATDEGEVPVGALAAPLAGVAVAELGVDGVGGDARVVADETAVASAYIEGERQGEDVALMVLPVAQLAPLPSQPVRPQPRMP